MDHSFSFKTITEFHQFCELPRPAHPLVSVIDYANFSLQIEGNKKSSFKHSYYTICIKNYNGGIFKYGQNDFHFDTGILSFFSPDQYLKMETDQNNQQKISGWILAIHPDFLYNTSLSKKIGTFDYFKYAVNEALFLSKNEEEVLEKIFKDIQQDCQSPIDKFTQNLIISKIETLLIYGERFYERQFYTESKDNHQLLERFEELLSQYFQDDQIELKGIPKVNEIARQLNVSPNYLGSVLRLFTKQNTQQHIQNKIIELAKIKLTSTQLTVSEIAYELGFEHSQSFNRLFKKKTKQTPLEFRASFN